MKRKRVLLDVDGVLADFHSAAVDLMEALFGLRIPIERFVTWDVTDVLNKVQRDECNAAIARPGFATSIKPCKGATEGVLELRSFAEVLFVTSPHVMSPTWAHERTEWLRRHFDASHGEVIHAFRKHSVSGDVFLDDKPSNVLDWQEHNLNGIGLLWDTPYNRLEGRHAEIHVLGRRSQEGPLNRFSIPWR